MNDTTDLRFGRRPKATALTCVVAHRYKCRATEVKRITMSSLFVLKRFRRSLGMQLLRSWLDPVTAPRLCRLVQIRMTFRTKCLQQFRSWHMTEV